MRGFRAMALMFVLPGLLGVSGAFAVPDPTRPPTAEEIRAWRGSTDRETTNWRLESVLISDHRRVAVVNNRRVTVGDRVDGARVLAIEPGRVRLQAEGRQLELTLSRQADKDNIRQDGSR